MAKLSLSEVLASILDSDVENNHFGALDNGSEHEEPSNLSHYWRTAFLLEQAGSTV